MILENAKPRLKKAIEEANISKESQDVKFIYNETLDYDTIFSVFEWLFREGVDFGTRHEEYRFVIIIFPKHEDF